MDTSPETSEVAVSISVSVNHDLLQALDGWIADQPDPKPNRSDAICAILEYGLEVAGPLDGESLS